MGYQSNISRQEPDKAWFLAQLKPNGLKLALRNLDRQGFATFCPRQDRTHRRGTRFVEKDTPLFPGYLFVQFDPNAGCWRAINSTYGVSRLVSFGGSPRPVPEPLIAGLQARTDDKTDALFSPGDEVEITCGAFADFVATVDSLAPEQRVWVLLDLMGRQTRVAIRPEDLSLRAPGC